MPGDRPQLLPRVTRAARGRAADPDAAACGWAVRLPVYGPRPQFGDDYGADRSTSPTTTATTSSASSASRCSPSPTARSSRSAGTRGGNRLWLRDQQGNAFYYAHLSAFSTLAVNGAHVRAGQVIGFMGNTGDAASDADAPPLRGAPGLAAVPRLRRRSRPDPVPESGGGSQDLPFPVATGWAPSVPGPQRARTEPGAILLGSSDISTAGGLDPELAAPGGNVTRRPMLTASKPAGRADRRRGLRSSGLAAARLFGSRRRPSWRRREHVLDEAARLGPGDRVEQNPERDAGDRSVVFRPSAPLALEPVARAAAGPRSLAQLVADVVVGRNAARERTALRAPSGRCRSRARSRMPEGRRRAASRPSIARSTYGLMFSAASVNFVFVHASQFLSVALAFQARYWPNRARSLPAASSSQAAGGRAPANRRRQCRARLQASRHPRVGRYARRRRSRVGRTSTSSQVPHFRLHGRTAGAASRRRHASSTRVTRR